ncbi:MAG: DUF4363 family protein [Oscillospiraceae bacterium]|nr:DUF4363 family protein [Oscillospiraceae bacterium]
MLAAILAFALWNSRAMTADTDRWRAQLSQSDALAQAGDWSGAAAVLSDSYEDWSARQTYLHIVSEHDAVDDAEAMYQRAMAFAAAQEPSEFRAELSDLRDQLRLLAEMERFSIGNIL